MTTTHNTDRPDEAVIRSLADDIGCPPWDPAWTFHTTCRCRRDIADWILPEVALRRQITVPGEEGLTTYVIAVVASSVVECTVVAQPDDEDMSISIRFIVDRRNPDASVEAIFTHAVDRRMQAAVISHMTWLRSARVQELAMGIKAILPPSARQNLALILSNSGATDQSQTPNSGLEPAISPTKG